MCTWTWFMTSISDASSFKAILTDFATSFRTAVPLCHILVLVSVFPSIDGPSIIVVARCQPWWWSAPSPARLLPSLFRLHFKSHFLLHERCVWKLTPNCRGHNDLKSCIRRNLRDIRKCLWVKRHLQCTAFVKKDVMVQSTRGALRYTYSRGCPPHYFGQSTNRLHSCDSAHRKA